MGHPMRIELTRVVMYVCMTYYTPNAALPSRQGFYNKPTAILQRGKTSTKNFLVIILNNLMVKF